MQVHHIEGVVKLCAHPEGDRQLLGRSNARYSQGSVDREMVFDRDGGLTPYLQADARATKQMASWLPIPEGKINLFLRSYLPEQDLIDQSYTTPLVRNNVMKKSARDRK